MNAVIAWFAENRVAANLLMVFILIAGAISLDGTRKEIIPNVSLDMINITVSYPGASPEDVEKSVITRVESAIYDIEGVKSIASRADEHFGVVTVEVGYGYDSKELLNAIKSRVDGIGSFPSDVKRPIIKELSVKNLVAYLLVSGPADMRSLRKIANNIKSDLTSMSAISQVLNTVNKTNEIAIEVSEVSLQRYGLSFNEVVAAVRQSSLDLPTGVIKTAQGEISIKAKGQVYWGDQFEEIVVRALPDGAQVLVGDVANVTDGFSTRLSTAEFNGEPAVALAVYRVGEQNILDISEALQKYIAAPLTFIPESIKLDIWQDTSVHFKSRIDLLTENFTGGMIVLFVILLLFLRIGLSFWVSLGIPISFMGAFWLLPYFGGSINMISLFAFILVLGIVVDDAIIVGENIFTFHRKGIMGLQGSVLAAQEVAKPVVFAVLTTIIAFLPLAMMPGPEGKLIKVIPIVVIATLIFSLLESLLILPAHLSGTNSNEINKAPIIGKLQTRFSLGLERFVRNVYKPFLEKCLSWRYLSMLTFVAIFIVACSLLASGWLKVVFYSTIEGDTARANVTFAQATSEDSVRRGIKKLEEVAFEIKRELKAETGEEQILDVLTSYSSSDGGSVVVEMAPSEGRAISGTDITDRWREKIGDIPDVTSLKFISTLSPSGSLVALELSSNSLDDLKAAANGLKDRLAEYNGVYGIRDSFQKGKQELQIELKPAARNLGLNLENVASQVRQAYHGTEVQSLQRGDEDVKVVVRYPVEERSSLWYLENMHIQLRDGSSVPLLTVADIQYGEGAAYIKRRDRRRVIKIDAKIDDSITTEERVMGAIRKDFLDAIPENYPGMTWSVAGIQKDRMEFKSYIKTAYFFALLGMYVMMATLFRSYYQPLMVMFAIPFGLVGALFGHMLLGMEVTLWSVIGMIAVSGVVVNDNLVLVDYINRKRDEGVQLLEAIREAGAARFRPIILTSLTTFGGLTPLMMESSLQAQFLIPMAVSLAFGVMFATSVSLILVPALYHIMHDCETLLANVFKNQAAPVPVLSVADIDLEIDGPVETAPSLSAGEEKKQWHVGLDEAYEQGYKDGLVQSVVREAPYDKEVLVASWEAGWDDGREELDMAGGSPLKG
ncbi:MAG: RND transporter [Moraxellaceae bacterium]|nr:MAG: RND transporter [Moraxellaceae bacterium]